MYSKIDSDHQALDGLKIYKKLMVATEFLLSSDLEEQYVEFLKSLLGDEEWEEFTEEILETLEQYEIKDDDIREAMSKLIKVPVIC